MTTSADHLSLTALTPPKEHRMTDTETTPGLSIRQMFEETVLLVAGIGVAAVLVATATRDPALFTFAKSAGFVLTVAALGYAAYGLVRWAAR